MLPSDFVMECINLDTLEQEVYLLEEPSNLLGRNSFYVK